MGLTYKQKFNKRYGQPLDKANSLTDISKLTGYKLDGLRKIKQKGQGAYYSNPASVRPSVKNPTQWGVARVYSAVMGGKAQKIDKSLLQKK